MSKSKKKRNKQYRGVDAKDSGENLVRVHKVEAVARSDRAQWLYDHRKLVRNVAIAVIVVAIIVFLIVNAIMSAHK